MKTRSTTGAATRPLTVAAILLVVAAFGNALLAGCGGSKTEQSSNTGTSSSTTQTSTSDTSGGGAAAAGFDPAKTFSEKCSTCHGPEGRGDGPAGAALNPKPRNYHDKAYMSTRTDQDLHDSIFNGKSAMPPWGKSGQLTDQQVWAMVKYVRELGSKP
jgi:mono/diheme cytochrome c family protein